MTSTVPQDDTALPALFEHCVRTYNAMLREAKSLSSLTESSQDSEVPQIIVYEGFLTTLVTRDLNLSVPYYTKVMRQLKRMGCVRQLKRGGGSAPSQWELIYEPTDEAFLKAVETKVPRQDKYEAQQEQIRALSQSVADLEKWQEAVNEALAKHFGVEAVE